jgi:pyridoxal phosphate enzyme (YggS family)
MPDIAQNLATVQARIAAAAESCGRDPEAIHLLAVSKTKPASAIRAAHACGQRAFGENYLQEALGKITELADLDLQWHYIGAIQSNKTRSIAEHFAWVHGLSSAKHARRLSEQRPAELEPLNVCVQVNLSGEASKSGVAPEQLSEFAIEIASLPRLRLRGLMTLPDPSAPATEQQADFRRLREWKDRLSADGLALDTLSMGMSGDLEAAIREGATWVRIGTAIFGARG